MDKKRRTFFFKLLDGIALICFIVSFSPLVIPKYQVEPFLIGIPYTMWVSFLISLFFLILAYWVSLVNKRDKDVD